MGERTSKPDDRTSQHDWWGVVLDAPDVSVLASFYSELRGWKISKLDTYWATLDPGEGVAYIAIQGNSNYIPPV